MKPAVLRPQAEQDLIDITRWYAEQGGSTLARRAFDNARKALVAVERMPGLGSPAIGETCGLSGLRHWGVEKFPLRWYYFERDGQLDVVRLLGERQDIAAILSAPPLA